MLTPSHGGHRAALAASCGFTPEELLDFSINVRPDGPPEFLRAALWRAMEQVDAYPDPYGAEAAKNIAKHLDLAPDLVTLGNGSNALIHNLTAVLAAQGRRTALILEPAFSEYAKACVRANMAVTHCLAELPSLTHNLAALPIPEGAVLFAGNPGNPSGLLTPPEAWVHLAQSRPDVFFVLDEAFIDYVGEGASVVSLLRHKFPKNIVVLRSLTKFYAIAGVRVGYALASANVTTALRDAAPEWSLNSFALAAVQAVLADSPEVLQDAEATRIANASARAELASNLAGLSGPAQIQVYPSAANYLLFHVSGSAASSLSINLAKKTGIILRDCANYPGLAPDSTGAWFRAAVRTPSENARLLDALRSLLGKKADKAARRVPAIMWQGTTSDAGKSVLAAAFCRIFAQDGLRVAPFKAQNMSLYGGNAGTDAHGQPLEMSRAQILQAQAARLAPDVRMNPIMLKPCSHTGSRVVVLGKDTGHMPASEYFSARAALWPMVTQAYDELAAESDIMVLEGAGSPGEINLKHGDVVNMAMARHANAKVLLAGDIDRGGLYAAFLGTYLTFTPEERALVLGFVVNRFRGDATLLGNAHDWLAARTGLPVLGVIPYMADLDLPQEDSLAGKGDTSGQFSTKSIDAALDRLADTVRKSIDMREIYKKIAL